MSTSMNPIRRGAPRIAAVFLAAGVAWILVTDRLVSLLTEHQAQIERFQSVKGLLFVGLLTVLVYALVRRHETRLEASRLKAEEARSRLDAVLRAAPTGMALVDPEGLVRMWTPAAARMFGRSEEGLLGRFPPLVSPETAPRFRRLLEINAGTPPPPEGVNAFEVVFSETELGDGIDGGRANLGSGRVVRADGSETAWSASSAPVRFEDRLLGHVIFLHDVSAVREREAALREEIGFGRQILDSVTEGILVCDESFSISHWNDGLTRFTGLSEEEVRGRDIAVVFPQAFGINVGYLLREASAGRSRRSPDFEFRTSGDESLRVGFAGFGPLHNPDGEVAGVIGTVTDITDRKRMAEGYRTLSEELESRVYQRTADLESFLYIATHDLKAPLRSLDRHAAVLLAEHAGRLDAEGVRLLHLVEDSSHRMGQLIDDLLQVSRVERQELEPAAVDLDKLVRNIIAGKDPGDRDIRFTVEDLPTVQADRVLIRQVLENLIDNAVKFSSGRDPAEVRVSGEEGPEGWILHVRDNGVGFDMRYADKLFKVFERLHYPDEFPGTGVGLAIVRRAVERHGGKVWAGSHAGSGAVFSFSLPRPEDTRTVLEE